MNYSKGFQESPIPISDIVEIEIPAIGTVEC